MISTHFIHYFLVAASATLALAAPSPSSSSSSSNGFSIDLMKRTAHHPKNRNSAWAAKQAAKLRGKYNPNLAVDKRAQGFNALTNLKADSTYFGSLAIGSPGQIFNVILDTGSSDLWVAGPNCGDRCAGLPIFDPSLSTTTRNLSRPFSIKYGSGAAAGDLFVDKVQMAGFEVSNQVFAVVDTVTEGLLDDPISGLLGLGWDTIASSGATPFAQALSQQGTLTQPLFGFFLTRFLDVLTTADNVQQFGGQFSLGFTNTSFYTGDIEFLPIPDGREAFWTLPMTSLTVQGANVPIPSGEEFAAIDTGTTLIGGPADVLADIFAQIPGAVRGTGDLAGYYIYPCATDVSVSISFGGRTWPISPEDFELMQIDRTRCVGAFFEIDLSGSSANPSWIVGDTFLKNVYSVYRFNPPAVGFAQLSANAAAQNRVGLPLPTQTIVANPVRVTATGSSGRITNGKNNADSSSTGAAGVRAGASLAAAVGAALLFGAGAALL